MGQRIVQGFANRGNHCKCSKQRRVLPFLAYRKGEMTREIEYCYGADYETINIGERFDFEDEQPGKKVEYNGEVDFIFDFDSIEEYSKHFGLVV